MILSPLPAFAPGRERGRHWGGFSTRMPDDQQQPPRTTALDQVGPMKEALREVFGRFDFEHPRMRSSALFIAITALVRDRQDMEAALNFIEGLVSQSGTEESTPKTRANEIRDILRVISIGLADDEVLAAMTKAARQVIQTSQNSAIRGFADVTKISRMSNREFAEEVSDFLHRINPSGTRKTAEDMAGPLALIALTYPGGNVTVSNIEAATSLIREELENNPWRANETGLDIAVRGLAAGLKITPKEARNILKSAKGMAASRERSKKKRGQTPPANTPPLLADG